MTTAEANAAHIFEDARYMRDAALERMEAGDIRDAAEKAWCATMRATEALVLARTGEGPSKSTIAGRRLRVLANRDRALWDLRLHFLERQEVLHGECFYHSYYDPPEIERMVRETAEYVGEAERLARG